MKKYLVSAVSFIIGAALAVTGTYAVVSSETSFLNSTDSPSTSVDITQLEYQRVQGDEEKELTWNNIPLKSFVKNKVLFPAACTDSALNTISDAKGVQDKFVFVKNNSDVPVYIRTYIAFEAGNLTAEQFAEAIGYNINVDAYDLDRTLYPITYGGENYYVIIATSVGTVASGGMSEPSLLQFYLKQSTTEVVGRQFGETYNVVVVSDASVNKFGPVDQEGLQSVFKLDTQNPQE